MTHPVHATSTPTVDPPVWTDGTIEEPVFTETPLVVIGTPPVLDDSPVVTLPTPIAGIGIGTSAEIASLPATGAPDYEGAAVSVALIAAITAILLLGFVVRMKRS